MRMNRANIKEQEQCITAKDFNEFESHYNNTLKMKKYMKEYNNAYAIAKSKNVRLKEEQEAQIKPPWVRLDTPEEVKPSFKILRENTIQ